MDISQPFVCQTTGPPQVMGFQSGIDLHTAVILRRPASLVGPRKWRREIDLHRQFDRALWPRVPGEPGVTCSGTGDDPHDGPVTGTEDSREGGFIDGTGLRTVPRMGVQPEAGEFGRLPSEIDLLLEVLRQSQVIQHHRGDAGPLRDQDHIGDVQQVSLVRNPEAADLSRSPDPAARAISPRRSA
ncbi:hypothetical protein GC163_20655 [bacterium]|nr:hypothetical protein [bacterium]